MPCGFGANSAANSTLPVFTRSRLAFSQVQPPCIAVLTITTGKESLMRSSIAARSIVCVPPPLAPVIGDALRVDLGQAEQEVEAAHGIERLQAHDALAMRLRLRAVEAPVLRRVHLRPLLGEAVHELRARAGSNPNR